ncbi:MAG TPA: hypothetical protein VJR89_40620 [Polyangiales bacterium]|nr:hypothetical protein [Polyangiales bacterium]
MTWLLPCLLRVRVARAPEPGYGVWLPVFLLWPLWFVALALFLVALVLATVFTGSREVRSAIAATLELHQLVAGLRGARGEVQGGGRHWSFVFV